LAGKYCGSYIQGRDIYRGQLTGEKSAIGWQWLAVVGNLEHLKSMHPKKGENGNIEEYLVFVSYIYFFNGT
jgi:hypothetical protein